MDGKYLLDTNVVIALFAGDSIVADFLEKAEDVFSFQASSLGNSIMEHASQAEYKPIWRV